MKKIMIANLLVLLSLVVAPLAKAEDLVYGVRWHWGFVDLDIAKAHVEINDDNGNFQGSINGHSIPWEGRVYCISDTLEADLTPELETVRYINGWYTKPLEGQEASYSDPATFANLKGEGTLNADAATMEAVYITASMLSIYYYAKTIDFPSLPDGKIISIPIAGTSGNDELQITYQGTDTSCTDGSTPVYKILFKYKYRGRLDAYPVQCEISQDERLPIFFSANISIGHVEMALTY